MEMVHSLILLRMAQQTTYDETTTTISLSTDNQSLEYVDENGNTTTISMCTTVDSCETVTSLTFNTSY